MPLACCMSAFATAHGCKTFSRHCHELYKFLAVRCSGQTDAVIIHFGSHLCTLTPPTHSSEYPGLAALSARWWRNSDCDCPLTDEA